MIEDRLYIQMGSFWFWKALLAILGVNTYGFTATDAEIWRGRIPDSIERPFVFVRDVTKLSFFAFFLSVGAIQLICFLLLLIFVLDIGIEQ